MGTDAVSQANISSSLENPSEEEEEGSEEQEGSGTLRMHPTEPIAMDS